MNFSTVFTGFPLIIVATKSSRACTECFTNYMSSNIKYLFLTTSYFMFILCC